jgi:hypothetical protein
VLDDDEAEPTDTVLLLDAVAPSADDPPPHAARDAQASNGRMLRSFGHAMGIIVLVAPSVDAFESS